MVPRISPPIANKIEETESVSGRTKDTSVPWRGGDLTTEAQRLGGEMA